MQNENKNKKYIDLIHLKWMFLIIVSIFAGIASVFIDPIFMIVGIIALLNVILILSYPMWGLLLYVLIFLLRFGEMFPALAPLRIELLTGAGVVLAIVIQQKFLHGTFILNVNRISILLVGFLGAMCLSFFTSYEYTATKDVCIIFIKLLVFLYIIISIVTTQKRLIIFSTWFVMIIAYLAITAFADYLSGQFTHTMNVDRLTGSVSSMGDPNALGATLVLTIPLIIALGLYYKKFIVKVGFLLLGLFMTGMMVLTASRSGLLAFFGIIISVIAFSKHRLLYGVLVILLSIGGWYLLPEQYQNRYMKFTEVSESIDEVSSGRIEVWTAGLNMILARPITGVGAGAFSWAYNTGEFGPPQWMQSHNLYIEVFASTGLLGFIVYFLFVFYLFKKLFKLARARYPQSLMWVNQFAKYCIVTIVGLLISGMFGHNLYRFNWFIIAGLCIALENITSKHSLELKNNN